MEEEERQEEIAAIVGALSAIDMQLQEVERTALKRAQIFRNEAAESRSPTSVQFNTGWYLLREIRSEVQEIREYIDALEEFVRTGTFVRTETNGTPKPGKPHRLVRTRAALKNAAASFQKASNALYIVGRALETEELGLYANHMYNLSESVEAEAKRARSALESTRTKPENGTGSVQSEDGLS